MVPRLWTRLSYSPLKQAKERPCSMSSVLPILVALPTHSSSTAISFEGQIISAPNKFMVRLRLSCATHPCALGRTVNKQGWLITMVSAILENQGRGIVRAH